MWCVNQPSVPEETWADRMIPSYALGSQTSLWGADLKDIAQEETATRE